MLLATYHMNNPRRDMHNPDVDDVLSVRRQEELQRMAEALLRFTPTVVAVEVEPAQQDGSTGTSGITSRGGST